MDLMNRKPIKIPPEHPRSEAQEKGTLLSNFKERSVNKYNLDPFTLWQLDLEFTTKCDNLTVVSLFLLYFFGTATKRILAAGALLQGFNLCKIAETPAD